MSLAENVERRFGVGLKDYYHSAPTPAPLYRLTDTVEFLKPVWERSWGIVRHFKINTLPAKKLRIISGFVNLPKLLNTAARLKIG
jgi:hypothetical protein